MTEQEITIDKKRVLELYRSGSPGQKKTFEEIFGRELFREKITERIKTFEDVLEVLSINEGEWYTRITGLEDDEIAYIQCKLIAEVFNEGWEVDYNDPDQWKYYVYLYFEGGGNASPGTVSSYGDPSPTAATLGSRLAFKSRALAKHAGELFLDVYKRVLIGKSFKKATES